MKTKELISLSVCCLLATHLVLYYTFIMAYLNNGQVVIKINVMGEANIELVILTLITIFGVWATYKLMRGMER